MRAQIRRASAAVGVLALLGCLVVASGLFDLRERLFGSATPPPKRSAFTRVLDGSTPAAARGRPTVLRSQPWWQEVANLQRRGAATESVDIDGDAIQWRVRARCATGRMRILPGLGGTDCPATTTAYGAGTGRRRLEIAADGPWRLRVEQQVDVPLQEPPLPAMTAPGSRVVARGDLYRIDQSADGAVTLYRLASGRYALRFEHVYVTPNVDLELRLSPLAAPRTTREYRSAPSAYVSRFDITAGSLNFMIPEDLDPRRYRSLVIWCPPVVSAYAAATLDAPS